MTGGALRIQGLDVGRTDRRGGRHPLPEWRLEPGTVTLIAGPNGSGKSTLLERLAGMRPAESLQVRYGDHPLWTKRAIGPGCRRNETALRQYGYAPQYPEKGLFLRTVEEELDFSLRPYRLSETERMRQVRAALDAVGWDESWLPRDPYRMSGGERRRVALLCVFATPAPWLLLDEPTAGLDGEGHELIGRYIASASGERGVVIVSHDLDWALPLADEAALLLPSGSIDVCGRDDLLACPQLLAATGMDMPLWLRTAHRLWRLGVPADAALRPAEAAAEAIAAGSAVAENGANKAERSAAGCASAEASDCEAASASAIVAAAVAEAPKPHHAAEGRRSVSSASDDRPGRPQPAASRVARYDPRAVWLGYLLIATAIFAQSDWVGLGIAAAATGGLLLWGQVSLARWRGVIVGYAWAAVLASALTAAGSFTDGVWFNAAAFAGTLFAFARTFVVMLLGFGIPLALSPLAVKRALEQLMGRAVAALPWAGSLLLTLTLLLRFVPVLLAEWERFGRLFTARGKQAARTPVAAVRRLRAMTIPLLLSLFRLGDDVSSALASRGVARGAAPTRGFRLKWRAKDSAATAAAAALAAGLWLLRHT